VVLFEGVTMNDLSAHAVAQQVAQMNQYGRVGATRLYRVPDLSAALGAPLGTIASAPLLTFRDPGTVIALYAQERLGTPAMFAGIDVRLQFNGDEDLTTNGQSGDFAPMLALVGFNTNWFPLNRHVVRGENWALSYRNQSGVAANPSVVFAFVADVVDT
jgi:hypothetical protein